MIDEENARISISREDLLTAARLMEQRAADAETELDRLLLVRRLIAASFELTRTLRAQTQCALVNHTGSTGMRSVEEATGALYEALAEYAARCREVASEARRTLEQAPTADWAGEAVALAQAGR